MKKTGKPVGNIRKIFKYSSWILIVILLASTVKNISKAVGVRKQVQNERERVQKMEDDNTKLQTQIAQVQGQDYIDKQIRDKLGLTKEGETVVILPDENVVISLAPPATTDVETLPDPNWKKWKNLFFEQNN